MNNRRQKVDLRTLNERIRAATRPLDRNELYTRSQASAPPEEDGSIYFHEEVASGCTGLANSSGYSGITDTRQRTRSADPPRTSEPLWREPASSNRRNESNRRPDVINLSEQIRVAVSDIPIEYLPSNSSQPTTWNFASGSSSSDPAIVTRPTHSSEEYRPSSVGANYVSRARRDRGVDVINTLNERIRLASGCAGIANSSGYSGITDTRQRTRSADPPRTSEPLWREPASSNRRNESNRRPGVINLSEQIRVAVSEIPIEYLPNNSSQPTTWDIDSGTSQPPTQNQASDVPPSYEEVIANMQEESKPPSYHELPETEKVQLVGTDV